MRKICIHCNTLKDKSEYRNGKGYVCKQCESSRMNTKAKQKQSTTAMRDMLLKAIYDAMKRKCKADLRCACEDIVKFFDNQQKQLSSLLDAVKKQEG